MKQISTVLVQPTKFQGKGDLRYSAINDRATVISGKSWKLKITSRNLHWGNIGQDLDRAGGEVIKVGKRKPDK